MSLLLFIKQLRLPVVKSLLGAGLLVAMLLFGGSATYTLWHIQAHNAQLEQRTYEVPWSLMQLQLEMSRFLDAVRLRHANALSEEDFMLRYDILWSRTPMLLRDQLKSPLKEQPDLCLLIEQIEARVQELEPTVLSFTPHSPAYLTILAELSPYLEPLSRRVTAVMHDNVRFYAQFDEAYRELGQRLQTQIIGLFITLGLLLLLLFRELRRYWLLQQKSGVTGLPNRLALQRYLQPLIEQAQPFSITILALKDFSAHHHRLGFEVMDGLVCAFAARLQHSLLPYEFMAQLDQETLLVVGKGVVELQEARAQLSRFRHALAEKAEVDGYDFYMEPLIGVLLYPADASNIVELLARAELALETCQQQQLPYVFFDSSLLNELSRRQQLAKDLPQAIATDSLRLRLVPVVAWPSRRCQGLHVEVSWHHPGLGQISAAELARVTEEYQRGESVLLWSLAAVCRQLPSWLAAEQTLFISLRVPASIFRSELANKLRAVLQQFGIAPKQLMLEVNEKITLGNALEVVTAMHAFQQKGMGVVLTEFGEEGSAITQLTQLPLTLLKSEAILSSDSQGNLVPSRSMYTLFTLAKSLHYLLWCTGLDSEAELNALAQIETTCLVQGDAISEPLAVSQVVTWLNSLKSLP